MSTNISDPKEYTIWRNMISRYRILVCKRWQESFKNFLFDVGHAPTKKHRIKRINSNGPYDQINVKWSLPNAAPVDTECYMLTFISVLPGTTSRHIMYKCLCACGTTVTIRKTDFTCKKIQSCGCQIGSPTHRESGKKEYRAWRGIIDRCTNPNINAFYLYGGRGITICDSWRNSYENFIADVGYSPTPAHSIDRINNDGNYEPGNVRWATKSIQSLNRKCRGGMECSATNCIHAIGIVMALLRLVNQV